jgi:hypothetical protein
MTITAATARQRLAEATQDLADAEAELEQARIAVSIGEAKDNDVRAVQRGIVRFQNRLEQAKVDARLAEERERVELEKAHRDAAIAKAAMLRITATKAAEQSERYRLWLLSVRSDAVEFNSRLTAYEQQLGRGSINTPGKFQSFNLLNAAVGDQLFHFTKPGSYSTQEG